MMEVKDTFEFIDEVTKLKKDVLCCVKEANKFYEEFLSKLKMKMSET